MTAASSRSPTDTHEKFAWLSVLASPRVASWSSTWRRSTATRSTRRATSSWCASASTAAAWASEFTENGCRTRSTADRKSSEQSA